MDQATWSDVKTRTETVKLALEEASRTFDEARRAFLLECGLIYLDDRSDFDIQHVTNVSPQEFTVSYWTTAMGCQYDGDRASADELAVKLNAILDRCVWRLRPSKIGTMAVDDGRGRIGVFLEFKHHA